MKDGITLLMDNQYIKEFCNKMLVDLIAFHIMDNNVIKIMVRIVIIKQDRCVQQVIELI